MNPILAFVCYAGRSWDGTVDGEAVSFEEGCLCIFDHDWSGDNNPTYSVEGHSYDCDQPARGDGIRKKRKRYNGEGIF